MKFLKCALAAALTVAVSGCGPTSSTAGQITQGETGSYLVSVFPDPNPLAPQPTFAGNYVKIVGTRDGLADLKYPCASQFSVCVEIGATGKLVKPVTDLCPTENTIDPSSSGTGNWKFTYALYTNSTCTGSAMTNLVCPDTVDEPIKPGLNVNSVQCTTENAQKEFNVCIIDKATGAHTGVGIDPVSQVDCATCKLVDQTCASNSACCTNVCASGMCAAACVIRGAACTSNAQCCSGNCTGGTCSAVTSCKAQDETCATGSECCSGTCYANKCDIAGCLPLGEHCSPGDRCCGGQLCVVGPFSSCCGPACRL